MPTVIGVIFFCCGLYCFLRKEDGLLGLLIIAAVFEAASAINFGMRGIQPYYVVAAYIIARGLVNLALGARSGKSMPYGRWLLIFGGIAIASAFISPAIFAGIPIYDPKIGVDDGLFIRPPLRFGPNNVIQASYLACHVLTAYALLAIRFSATKTRKAFIVAFYIEVLFVVAESVCQIVGIRFPLSLVLNNPGYALWSVEQEAYGTRNPGTFSEPSFAGAFLVLYAIGFLAQYFARKGGYGRVLTSLVASAMVGSSSSLLILGLSPFLLMVRYSPFRFPWYVNLKQVKRIVGIIFLIVVPLVSIIVFSAGFREVLMGLTVSKGETGSFVNRTASDLYALQLVIQTHGIGVGLGSSRTSSFIGNLLSNVGVAASVAFAVFLYKLLTNLPKDYEWFKWGAFAFLLNIGIGVADITMPMLWCFIIFSIQLASTMTRKKLHRANVVMVS